MSSSDERVMARMGAMITCSLAVDREFREFSREELLTLLKKVSKEDNLNAREVVNSLTDKEVQLSCCRPLRAS
jgi:hypothetical protein